MEISPSIECWSARTETWLHRMLRDACSIQRSGPGHWLPKKSDCIRIPGSPSRVATLRRAIFAAFVDDAPEGVDLRSSCGHKYCVRPDHQEQRPARALNVGRLSFRDHLEARRGASEMVPVDPRLRPERDRIPAGVTARAAAIVASMVGSGRYTVAAAAEASGLTKSEAVALANGRWAAALARSGEAARKDQRRREGAARSAAARAAAAASVLAPCPPSSSGLSSSPGAKVRRHGRATPEELEWLASMGIAGPVEAEEVK
jgi:hypothetical protein